MSSKRGRNRNSGAVSDRRSDDSKGSPSASEKSESSVGLEFEYETEDGLKIEIDPFSAEISREYQITEEDAIEFSAGIDWTPADFNVEKKGRDLSVSGEIGIPGDLLGISGGLTLDLGTGEISGGEVGIELGGVDIEVEISEDGCRKSFSVSIFGFGIGYVRDDCQDEEEEEEEDNKKPSSNDRLTQESVEDIMKRWREKGDENICGDIPLHLHTTWHAPDTPVSYAWGGYALRFSRGGIWNDYAGDAEENEMMIGWVWDLFLGTHPDERLIVAKGFEPQFDACMDNLYGTNKEKKILPPSPPPERLMDNCCREATRLMRDIHKALACQELLSKGFETPNRWIVSGGKKYTKHKDYLSIIEFQMRMQDHLGIHPFRAEVTDTNAAQEGNQSAAVEFANATAAVKQIAELLLENKGDSATRLNLMIRTAVAVGQVLNVVSIIAKTIEGIVQYLGMPIKERVFKVKMPFDFTFGARNGSTKGKGFGKGTQGGVDKLDINTEEATEALLPKFMQDTEQPIIVEDFDDRASDLTDIIRGK